MATSDQTPYNSGRFPDPWGNDREAQKLDHADIQAQLNMPPGEYLPLRAGGHIASMPQEAYTGPVARYYRAKAQRQRRRQRQAARMRRIGAALSPWLAVAAIILAVYWAAVTGLPE